jgi:outer membrane immunogenic protein
VQAGYAWDRTLWYVKGGYAGGEMKLNSITIPVGTLGPAKTNLNGWTVGSGIEYAWQNLSVGLEYDYIRLEGGATTCAPNNPASVFTCAGGLPLRYANIASDVQQVVVRLNYELGDPWGKAAVVAKY